MQYIPIPARLQQYQRIHGLYRYANFSFSYLYVIINYKKCFNENVKYFIIGLTRIIVIHFYCNN